MLHSFNLQHGVDVFEVRRFEQFEQFEQFESVNHFGVCLQSACSLPAVCQGERYSVIFWFKDSEASVKDGSTPWYDKMAVESSDTSAT